MFKAVAVLCLLLPGGPENCVLESEDRAGPYEELEACKAALEVVQSELMGRIALPVPWVLHGFCLPAGPPAAPSRPA